jgi:SAM-dependent methyltransferase
MSMPPSSEPRLPLGSDGYPAAGGVARRPVGDEESARANRRWWDAAAPAYLAEHEADLGEVDFLWGPEGLREDGARLLGDVAGRRVLEIGCGSAPCSRWLVQQGADVVAFDLSAGMLARAAELNRSTGIDVPLVQADAAALPLADASFDVVLYRLVLHHIAFQGPLAPCFEEAARLLRPGGVLVAIEPGLWHPVGAGLQLANRAGLGVWTHGTPDDVPLSPRELLGCARAAGLAPELHAVTYGWRRLPTGAQRLLHRLDGLGSRPRLAPLGHTLMLIARRYSTTGRPNPGSSKAGPVADQPSRS